MLRRPMSQDAPVLAQETLIRSGEQSDVAPLAELLTEYIRETHEDAWHGSEQALSRDGFGAHFRFKVAQRNGQLVGFAAWQETYDLHHCTAGGEIVDIFVLPRWRGRVIGPALVCAVARDVHEQGGKFLKGQAVNDRSVSRLYERVAISSAGTDYIIAGRALRHVAKLSGATARVLALSLPDRLWSYEA